MLVCRREQQFTLTPAPCADDQWDRRAGDTEAVMASVSRKATLCLAAGDNEVEVKIWKGGLREAEEEK